MPPAAPPPPSEAPAASTAPAASAGPAESAAPAASAPASAAPAASGGPPGPGDWDKWSHDQKLEYMKTAVMPKMGGEFHDFDAKRYAEPKCVLCHGSGAKDGSFKMPNPDAAEAGRTPAGFKALAAKKPGRLRVHDEAVEPDMAALLGEAPFDPKTQQGFGCFDCHTQEEVACAGAHAALPQTTRAAAAG